MDNSYTPEHISVWFIRRDGWARRMLVPLPLQLRVCVGEPMDLEKIGFGVGKVSVGDQPVKTLHFELEMGEAAFPWSEPFHYREV